MKNHLVNNKAVLNKPISRWQKLLTYLLCSLLIWQPALANVVVSGNGTTITSAGNGVEVVNIAAPDNNGLSHNQYQEFHVDSSGLILNNSTEQLGTSELGGILQNNPNFTGQAADVILNEVTGANASQLQGYTEVFGQRANVILTNPYGITCNGCGFLNTPRVTLSTGTPEFEKGELSGFDVSQGTVNIEGLGLDASRQDYFDIISRTTQINAAIHANDLNIISGRNKVDYQSNHITEKVADISEESADKPQIAIDTASLGGMYAGRIYLVSTEDGVGVNVGDLAASQSDIHITASGQVVLGNTSSANNLNVSTTENLIVNGNQAAGQDMTLSGSGLAAKQSSLVTGRSMTLYGDAVELTQSGIEANQLNSQVGRVYIDEQSQITTQSAKLEQLSVLNNKGTISVSGKMAVSGDTLSLTGVGNTTADTLKIQAKTVSFETHAQVHNAELTANNTLTLSRDAQLSASNDIALTGKIINQSGTLKANQTINMNGKQTITHRGSTQGKTVNLSTQILNQTGQLTGDNHLNLHSETTLLAGKTTAGKQLVVDTDTLTIDGQVQSGDELTLTSQKDFIAKQSSQLLAKGDLTVKSNNSTLSGSAQSGNALTLVTTNALTTHNNAKLISGGKLTVNASTFTHKGDIISDDDLTVTAKTLTNHSELTSAKHTTLNLTGELTNQSDGVISGNETIINTRSLTNQGTLQALSDLILTTTSLTNPGALIALGDLIANVTGSLTNQGLMYAGGDGIFNVADTLLNQQADIIVGGNATVQKTAQGGRTQQVYNLSGTIEALGSLSVLSDLLTNSRKSISHNITTDAFTPTNLERTVTGSVNCMFIFCTLSYDEIRERHLLSVEKSTVNIEGEAARLLSGDTLFIDATTLQNQASHIASGNNLTIHTNQLENSAYVDETVTTHGNYLIEKGKIGIDPRDQDKAITMTLQLVDIDKARVVNKRYLASISAENDVTINANNTINNATVQSNAAKYTPSATNQTAKETDANDLSGQSAHDMDNLKLPSATPIPFPDYPLPSNPNGLFIYSDGPSSGYLIETNPLLTNVGDFLGSDYFQNKLGFNPNTDIKFLGDAFYDARIITQAIIEQTGQRYLNKNIGSDLSQMQQLMDAAAKQKTALNLTLGIALTAEQIAQLTQDILWYEETEINGQTVLAPKLYLAQLTEHNISAGAVITGQSITIHAGEIENSGSLIASDQLKLKSDRTITNDTGILAADGDIILLAKGDINNMSGVIEGQDISITSTEGSFINQTLSEQLSVDDQGKWQENHSDQSQITRTIMADTASVTGSNSISITTGNNIISTGASIESGGDATLSAMNAIVLDTIQTEIHTDTNTGRKQTVSSDTNYVDNRVVANGSLTLQSGGNLVASGGEIKAEEVLTMQVGGDLTLLANETHRYRAETSSNKKEIERQTRQEGSALSAGDTLNITTGGDANFVASTVKSGDNLNIQTGGELNAVAALESDYQLHFEKKSGLFGSSTSETEIHNTTAKGTSFTSGGEISLITQGNQNHQASEFVATDTIHIESTQGELIFIAAEESGSYRHETKKSGVMVKMKGKGDTSTTQKLTSMQSGGDITLASALGMQVDYVSTDGQLGKALNALPAGDQYAWMAQLKDNPNVNWNEVNEAFDSWSYSEQSLSGPAAAIIAIAVTVVTAGAGAAAAGAIGATGTVSSAAVSAATSTLISQASLSFINNGGDISATLKDLGSSANSKALIASILTAGALAGYDSVLASTSSVNDTALASGNLSIYTPTPTISVDSVLTQVGRSGIESGISATIYDSDFSDAFINSLQGAIANDIGALAANEIGDLGLKNGSLEKTALHSVTQGGVTELAGGDFAAGAAAGAVTELTGDLIGNSGLDKQDQINLSGLMGAGAGVLATGDAEGAYSGQTAGMGVFQFNHLNHDTKVLLEALKESCSTNKAACEVAMQLELLDKQTDQDLFESCSSGDANCAQKMEAAQKDLNSYSNLLPEDDYELYKEKDSIENVLIGIDPNYPKWDTEGMKEFGYSMLSEPEGVLLCMGMTMGSCGAFSLLSTGISTGELVFETMYSPDTINHYKYGSLGASIILGKAFAQFNSLSSVSNSTKYSTETIENVVSVGLNSLAKQAKEFDGE